jgi:hypothetical protein
MILKGECLEDKTSRRGERKKIGLQRGEYDRNTKCMYENSIMKLTKTVLKGRRRGLVNFFIIHADLSYALS